MKTTTKLTTVIGGSHLPEEFERSWTAMAEASGVTDHFDVKHVEQRFGLWTITLKANDKVVGVRKAENLEAAALELFNLSWPLF
jgi:hypothetical protein